ncbi:MAG: hypothetical protein ACRCZI_14945 [Cetobacterium sp.]
MAEEQDVKQPSDEDIAKAQNWIKEQVKAQLSEMQSQEVPRQSVIEQQRPDQLRDILDPYIAPAVQQARLDAMSAVDESRFYRNNPDALDFESQIESTFNQLMKDGRPLGRADIYHHLIGRMAVTEPDKFNERQKTKHNTQLAKANSAVDFGFNSVGREKEAEEFKAFDKLTSEEMEKRLEGIVF